MAEPENLVLALLRELRLDVNVRFDGLASEMRAGFKQQDSRATALESRMNAVTRAFDGESVLGRYTVAEVEERLNALEKRLGAIEAQR